MTINRKWILVFILTAALAVIPLNVWLVLGICGAAKVAIWGLVGTLAGFSLGRIFAIKPAHKANAVSALVGIILEIVALISLLRQQN